MSIEEADELYSVTRSELRELVLTERAKAERLVKALESLQTAAMSTRGTLVKHSVRKLCEDALLEYRKGGLR